MRIFKNISGNIPGGNFQGGSLIGLHFPGGSFPDAKKNICEEFSSVHALTLSFIRKIFILQTYRLRVYSPTNNIFSYGAKIFPHPLAHLTDHVSDLIGYTDM